MKIFLHFHQNLWNLGHEGGKKEDQCPFSASHHRTRPIPSVGIGVAVPQLTVPMGTQALAATWPTGHGVSHFCHLNKGRTVGVRAAVLALLAALNQSDLG